MMKWLVACLTLNACFAGMALADGQSAAPDPKAPQLVTPGAGFQLSQPVNGWTFVWQLPTGATQPERYELWVQSRLSRKPLLDMLVEKPAYTFVDGAQAGGGDWFWKVRTYANGQYGPWSEERTFRVVALANPTGAGQPAGQPQAAGQQEGPAPVLQPAGPVPQGEAPDSGVGEQQEGPLPVTPELREYEKYLLARIKNKARDAQTLAARSQTLNGFTRVRVHEITTGGQQAYGVIRSGRGAGPFGAGEVGLNMPQQTVTIYKGVPRFTSDPTMASDASIMAGEAGEAEWELIRLYFAEGRLADGVLRLKELARRRNPLAAQMLLDLSFAEAQALYQEFLDTGNTAKKKAAISRLWELHRQRYGPATDALRALDIL